MGTRGRVGGEVGRGGVTMRDSGSVAGLVWERGNFFFHRPVNHDCYIRVRVCEG